MNDAVASLLFPLFENYIEGTPLTLDTGENFQAFLRSVGIWTELSKRGCQHRSEPRGCFDFILEHEYYDLLCPVIVRILNDAFQDIPVSNDYYYSTFSASTYREGLSTYEWEATQANYQKAALERKQLEQMNDFPRREKSWENTFVDQFGAMARLFQGMMDLPIHPRQREAVTLLRHTAIKLYGEASRLGCQFEFSHGCRHHFGWEVLVPKNHKYLEEDDQELRWGMKLKLKSPDGDETKKQFVLIDGKSSDRYRIPFIIGKSLEMAVPIMKMKRPISKCREAEIDQEIVNALWRYEEHRKTSERSTRNIRNTLGQDPYFLLFMEIPFWFDAVLPPDVLDRQSWHYLQRRVDALVNAKEIVASSWSTSTNGASEEVIGYAIHFPKASITQSASEDADSLQEEPTSQEREPAQKVSSDQKPLWDEIDLPESLRALAQFIQDKGGKALKAEVKDKLHRYPTEILRDFKTHPKWGAWFKKWISNPKGKLVVLNIPTAGEHDRSQRNTTKKPQKSHKKSTKKS